MTTPSAPSPELTAAVAQASAFVTALLSSLPPNPSTPARAHITLTYAQSLDAKIAGLHGRQLALSGRESMLMTHMLRARHDAILVGVGTVLNDDPQLNVRLLPPPTPGSPPYPSPQPIILDPSLRTPPTCKLLLNHAAGRGSGKQPWLICARLDLPDPAHPELRRRKALLSEAGAEVFEVECAADGTLHLPALLALLHSKSLRSLMVEGGQRVISSFLTQALFDLLIVTVAPVLVGPAGVGFARSEVERVVVQGESVQGGALGMPSVRSVRTEVFGRDAVLAMVPVPVPALVPVLPMPTLPG